MKVQKVSVYNPVRFGGSRATGIKPEENVVQAARKELEKINSMAYEAGTDVAWWRSEFREAKRVLEDLANGIFPEAEATSYVRRFHDPEEDGFI